MRSLRLSRRGMLAGSAATAAAFGIVKAPAPAAEFAFKCGSDQASDHPSSIRLTQMWSTIGQESGGRIHTQFFPNSELGGSTAMFSQLRLGALEFFYMSPGNLSTVVPSADISRIGFAYKDEDEGLRAMGGPLGTYIRNEVAAKGMYALRSHWNSGMNHISSSSRPIRTPADLHGFKVRVIEGKASLDLFKTLGASPLSLPFNELYTALQTKLVDGQTSALVSIEKSHFYEVQRYISLTNHAWSGSWLVANGNVWKSLPADLQAIVERNNTRYAAVEQNDTKTINTTVGEKLAAQGMVVNSVDAAPFRPILRPYFEYWASAFGPTEWGLLESAIGRKLV